MILERVIRFFVERRVGEGLVEEVVGRVERSG